ncbi:uncharacterized protein LOC100036845 precursor [Xenopus laevis]|uniref:LOC100036845 protein n=1 Tax=Xenopus laevis TaxID=8355 RepID=A1L1H6_XENLA|nr:Ovostatin-like precursor [Xenopus laevis]AAI29065.1 LOC100036845 protein [Xenopus laevis]
MNQRRFLLFSCLLGLIAGATSKLHHVLTIPVQLSSGGTQRACVNLQDYEEAVSLHVVLLHNGVETTIFEETVQPPCFFMCKEFPVPEVESDTPVAVTLSAISGEEEVLDRKTVVIVSQQKTQTVTFIQFDKPIYKPGNKVDFRLITMDSLLHPVNQQFSAVYLQDPSGSRIAQWLDLTSQRGVAELFFQLISDAAPGSYNIIIESTPDSIDVMEYFTVEEYIPPRFSVSVAAPQTLSVLDETAKFNVSAVYTYGQPVPGRVTVRICKQVFPFGRSQNCLKDKSEKCLDTSEQLGPDGTYQAEIDLNPLSIGLSVFGSSLSVDITVVEEGTGVQVRENRYIGISSQLASLSLDYESLQQYYKRGLPYVLRVTLINEKGQPLVNEKVDLEIQSSVIQEVNTDQAGKAEFQIDTSSFAMPNFTFKVSYQNPALCYYSQWENTNYPSVEYQVLRFYSESGSFLQLYGPKEALSCGKSYSINVQYIVNCDKAGDTATFFFLVMSKEKIVLSGAQDVDVTTSKNGSISINIDVTSELVPSARVIVYSILHSELIADTVTLNIETCFKHQVSLSFSEDRGPPASNVDLKISAAPGAFCGVRVIDSSLLLLNSYERFSASNVYSSIPYLSFYGYNVGELDLEEPKPPCEDPHRQIFYNGSYYIPISSYSEGDSYGIFKQLGLVVGTEYRLRKPVVCGYEQEPIVPIRKGGFGGGFGGPMLTSVLADGVGTGRIETVRKDFRETFVWKMVVVDSEGKLSFTEKVPDTITEWKGSMFCLSEEQGFGMTTYTANYTSFLPFFVEPSLPYSITRGETMVLRAFVSNYLQKCITISVTLAESADFEAAPQDVQQDKCICAGGRATYSWNVDAKTLGEISFSLSAETTNIGDTCEGPNDPSQPLRKDTVIRTVLVEAEGIRREVTSSNLVCVDGSNTEIPISITPPENIVSGSADGYIIALGDVIGLPLSNLQNLLQMPYGCGEQNLARLAPIPDVLDYLNNTGQLTDKILQTGIKFMTEGYYRQTRYKLWNGAYSTFWGWAAQSNSWLTAYTFKTLEKCKKYIFIDKNIQQQTLIYLEQRQKLESGCFMPEGQLFIKEDEKDEEAISVQYTAFLAIALLESNYSLGKTLLDGAMGCLRNASTREQKMINKALMLYAFTLAGDEEHRASLLEAVKQSAVSEGGSLHWEREGTTGNVAVPFFYPRHAAANVEVTAYILLSIAKGSIVTQEDLTYMAQIAVWLIRQQNSFGGFRSTQDTVVALQALTSYGRLIYKPNANHNLAITSGNDGVGQMTLNQSNRLLVQRQPLPEVPGEYGVGVSGTGCCLIQSTVRYNIPVPDENSAFSMSATSSGNCLDGVATLVDLTLQVSYQGNRDAPSTVIIDVKLLSGYQADYLSLYELENAKLIARFEEKNGHVILYLNSISSEPVDLTFKMQMGSRVLNVMSSSVYVYDYYEADENGYASYSHPCPVAT